MIQLYEHHWAIEDRGPLRQSLGILLALVQVDVLTPSNLQNLSATAEILQHGP